MKKENGSVTPRVGCRVFFCLINLLLERRASWTPSNAGTFRGENGANEDSEKDLRGLRIS